MLRIPISLSNAIGPAARSYVSQVGLIPHPPLPWLVPKFCPAGACVLFFPPAALLGGSPGRVPERLMGRIANPFSVGSTPTPAFS
jgi:hypothetical protein